MKKLLIILVCFFIFFDAKSKHHKNLTGLKLVCSIGKKKHGFEFVDKQFFSEHIFTVENGNIQEKGTNFHYLTDKNYVYLERLGSVNKIFITINRASLYINDNQRLRCAILDTPIIEYFKKLKKNHQEKN